MSFRNGTFRSKAQQEAYNKTISGRYQLAVRRLPFLYMGLPFLTLMAIGSVALSNFTALRYERRDQKVQELDGEQHMKLVKNKRTVNVKEEYYRLQHLGEEDWEPVRVPRLKGEEDNVMAPKK